MKVEDLLNKIKNTPEEVQFAEVIETIDNNYRYTPSKFTNGLADLLIENEAGKNEGSCKILAFAKIHALSKNETLNCFGDYYRKDVLNNPNGDDHKNIRNFIQYGWEGVSFQQDPLEKV